MPIFSNLPQLASFLLACFVISIIPGSTVTNVVSAGLARGFRAGIATEIGAQIGRFTIVLLVAIAVDLVTGFIAAAFDWIKYIGAAYLVWLGVRFLMTPGGLDATAPKPQRSFGAQIVAGLAVALTNPKSYLFFGAFLPQFASRDYPLTPQIIVLGLMEMAIALVTDGLYLYLAVTARDRLDQVANRRINQAAGVILMVAAVWLALQHQA